MLSDIQNLDRSGRREFRFRLNGEIMLEIFVQRAMVDGEPIGPWEIAVEVDGIGLFTIDDNSNLWDPALPQSEQ